jgi:hypothetical protein
MLPILRSKKGLKQLTVDLWQLAVDNSPELVVIS